MSKIIRKPRAKSQQDRDEAIIRPAALSARDPVAYDAILKMLG
jgi:hypothetical protein